MCPVRTPHSFVATFPPFGDDLPLGEENRSKARDLIMAKTAILLAAGSSTRMGAEIPDKVLEAIAGKPLFLFAVEAFLRSGVVDDYILVYRDREQRAAMAEQLRQPRFERAKRMWVKGGVERRDSVLNALRPPLFKQNASSSTIAPAPDPPRDHSQPGRNCGAGPGSLPGLQDRRHHKDPEKRRRSGGDGIDRRRTGSPPPPRGPQRDCGRPRPQSPLGRGNPAGL